jgi:AcrR family transcriptional regulator
LKIDSRGESPYNLYIPYKITEHLSMGSPKMNEGSVDSQDRPRKDYSQHYDRQRESVLNAAERLFILRGIEDTAIADIAFEAGLTRSTLYRYFPNKQDIAWELLKGYFEEMSNLFKLEAWAHKKTGYERVEAFIEAQFNYYWQNLDRAIFMAQFDQIYAARWKPERMIDLLQGALGERRLFLNEAIEVGIADGSLRADLEPRLAAATIINMIVGLERRLASMPRHVEAEYGQTVEEIYREACRILLRGIQHIEKPLTLLSIG